MWLSLCQTVHGELPLTALTGVRAACPAGAGLSLGRPVGRLLSGSTDRNLGHMRTCTGHGACQGLCHVPNEQMFIPQHFSSWGLSNALKKKKKKELFTLIIPFCCLCLFCFALFFFSHTLRTIRVRKFCPAAFWNRPFHSLNQEPFVLGSEQSSGCLVTCILALLPCSLQTF